MPLTETAEQTRTDRSQVEPVVAHHIDWEQLSAGSDQPDVQNQIRRELRKGTIRVAPFPGCPERVQIVPAHNGNELNL